MITRHQTEQPRTRACDQAEGRGRRHVLKEELFRTVLSRERKRADRSNQPLVLMLVDVNDGVGADSWSIGETAIEALAAATRETDVLGWFERRAVIGVILPETRVSDLANTCEGLDTRVRRQLAKRVDGETLGRFSIRLRVYPEPRRAGEEGVWQVDPLLYPKPRSRQEQRTIYDAIKRGLDVIGSLTLLLMLSPLLLLIVVLLKLTSRGPVIFRQVRIGQMMKPFTMLKFRTMYSGTDHGVHHEFVSRFIKASGQVHEPGKNRFFKLTNDPRVTPVGRVLRKTSLDELPQLWNVLRGDMSLVGPRPPLPYELEQYKPSRRPPRSSRERVPADTARGSVEGREWSASEQIPLHGARRQAGEGRQAREVHQSLRLRDRRRNKDRDVRRDPEKCEGRPAVQDF